MLSNVFDKRYLGIQENFQSCRKNNFEGPGNCKMLKNSTKPALEQRIFPNYCQIRVFATLLLQER